MAFDCKFNLIGPLGHGLSVPTDKDPTTNIIHQLVKITTLIFQLVAIDADRTQLGKLAYVRRNGACMQINANYSPFITSWTREPPPAMTTTLVGKDSTNSEKQATSVSRQKPTHQSTGSHTDHRRQDWPDSQFATVFRLPMAQQTMDLHQWG